MNHCIPVLETVVEIKNCRSDTPSVCDDVKTHTQEGWHVAPACVQRPSLVEDVTVVRLVTAPLLGFYVSIYM